MNNYALFSAVRGYLLTDELKVRRCPRLGAALVKWASLGLLVLMFSQDRTLGNLLRIAIRPQRIRLVAEPYPGSNSSQSKPVRRIGQNVIDRPCIRFGGAQACAIGTISA